MESRDEELQPQPLSDVQVVASCDSSVIAQQYPEFCQNLDFS